MLSPTEDMFEGSRAAPTPWTKQIEYNKRRRHFTKDSDGLVYAKDLSDEEPNEKIEQYRKRVANIKVHPVFGTAYIPPTTPHDDETTPSPLREGLNDRELSEGRLMKDSSSHQMAQRLVQVEKEVKRTQSVGNHLRMGPRPRAPSLKSLMTWNQGPLPPRSSASDDSISLRTRASSHGSSTMPTPGPMVTPTSATSKPYSPVSDIERTPPARPPNIRSPMTPPAVRSAGIDRSKLTVFPTSQNASVLISPPSPSPTKSRGAGRARVNSTATSGLPRFPEGAVLHEISAAHKTPTRAAPSRAGRVNAKASMPKTIDEIFSELQEFEETSTGDSMYAASVESQERVHSKGAVKNVMEIYAELWDGSQASLTEEPQLTDSLTSESLTSDSLTSESFSLSPADDPDGHEIYTLSAASRRSKSYSFQSSRYDDNSIADEQLIPGAPR